MFNNNTIHLQYNTVHPNSSAKMKIWKHFYTLYLSIILYRMFLIFDVFIYRYFLEDNTHTQITALNILSSTSSNILKIIMCCPWGLFCSIDSSINLEDSDLERRSLSILLKSRVCSSRKMQLDHLPFWLDCLPHSSVFSVEMLFPLGHYYSSQSPITEELECYPPPLEWRKVELQTLPSPAWFKLVVSL